MLARAFRTFQNTNDRPTLIIVDSHIGYGAPQQAGHQRSPRRTAGRRGDPARQAQLRLAGRREILRAGRRLRPLPRRASASAASNCATPGSRESKSIASSTPSSPKNFSACNTGSFQKVGITDLPEFPADPKGLATRESSGKVLNAFAKNIPWLIGGSADLAPSTKTRLTLRGRGRFLGRELCAGGTSISGSANMLWGPS